MARPQQRVESNAPSEFQFLGEHTQYPSTSSVSSQGNFWKVLSRWFSNPDGPGGVVVQSVQMVQMVQGGPSGPGSLGGQGGVDCLAVQFVQVVRFVQLVKLIHVLQMVV